MPSVQKTSPRPLWRHFFLEGQKFKSFGQFLKKCLFGHNQAKTGQFCIFFGCGLPNSAAILRRPVPHVGFLSRKIQFLASKNSKKGRFWQKTLCEYFGFSAARPRGRALWGGVVGHLLETPLLRTLVYCKAHHKPPSKIPSGSPSLEPFSRTLPKTISNPFLEACVVVRTLRCAPKARHPGVHLQGAHEHPRGSV